MNAKTLIGAVVAGCWLACASAGAQETTLEVPPVLATPPGQGLATPLPPVEGPGVGSPSGLSDWITYRRPWCCSEGPVNPLYAELFFRAGASFPVGGNYLGRVLQTGFTVEGGARTLLFNTEATEAFVVEAHIVNSNNSGGGFNQPTTLNVRVPNQFGVDEDVTVQENVRRLNRTMVGIGVGREWYQAPVTAPGSNWRYGVDAGGRWGSASVEYDRLAHGTDVVGGVWAALHTDYEVPCGCCWLQYGARLEWAYTWSDILQRQSDVQELNLLVNFGVRY